VLFATRKKSDSHVVVRLRLAQWDVAALMSKQPRIIGRPGADVMEAEEKS